MPLAVIGFIVAWGRPHWRELNGRQSTLLLFGIWAAVETTFFNEAGFYHRYYLATLSPSIAALAGIGVVTLWRLARTSSWKAGLLPAAVGVTAAVQLHLLDMYPAWRNRLEPALVVGTGAALMASLTMPILRKSNRWRSSWATSAVGLIAAASFLTLFAAPGIWSYATINRGYQGALPVAGPDSRTSIAAFSDRSDARSTSNDAIVRAQSAAKLPSARPAPVASGQIMMNFLNAHRTDAAYVVAVPSSKSADTIIIDTGAAVMTLGGFSGSDPIVDVPKLKGLIKSHQIRFFLLQSGSGSLTANLAKLTRKGSAPTSLGPEPLRRETVTAWVEKTCALVSPAMIAAATPHASKAGLTGLYDCTGKGAG